MIARCHPQRQIEMHLQYGETLFVRSAGGVVAPCSPHEHLPHHYSVDLRALRIDEFFRYCVRRPDGGEREERFFVHRCDRGGPVDVWEGIRAVDNSYYVLETREHIARRGFAVIPGLVSPEVLAILIDKVRPHVDAVWGAGGCALHGDKINLEKLFLRVPGLLAALVEKLAPLLSTLMGGDVFLEYEQVMVVRAGSAYRTHRHRDVDGGQAMYSEASLRDKRSVHIWIPLVDTDGNSACMYVEPYDGTRVDVAMHAGDALILDNYVWHGSHTNAAQANRLSWLLNLASAPAHDASNPHADLNLPILQSGNVVALGPDECDRVARAKSGVLNLFEAYFTYDVATGAMVNVGSR
jgi:hypothetical protein